MFNVYYSSEEIDFVSLNEFRYPYWSTAILNSSTYNMYNGLLES